jgi:cation transport ATPase
MALGHYGLYLLVAVITCISGFFDGLGFLYASRIWAGGNFSRDALLRSAASFTTGISLYFVSLKYQDAVGVRSPEVQTIFWFGVTLISMSILSGQFLTWRSMDQAVAVGVLLGIGWLIFRTGG